ncbi:STM4015 family protein [Streptomyces albipurpureus]|uniref:STM4015 family protein n=1 Tax=Streptomyces albipurpureus TaxID=2897419 RepID=A0ABT0UE47_9ACTN|nr:STM4015 family protein [Streptomyces sp. CWNU-1]MCM2386758.1 STM4015 family protein [Streptomyces sp. CWNU-1]
MTINSHLQELHGLPAFDFPRAEAQAKTELPPVSSVAWRIAAEYEGEEWEQAFARFLDAVDPTEVRALIVGLWNEAYETSPASIISTLTGAADRFPALRAIFFGDITYDECEISWINQGLVTPVLDAFPELLEFGVRGGTGLEFPAVRHEKLESLVVESGGLGVEVVRGIAASELPALANLDIWLGSSWYGADTQVADLEPFLAGTLLPKLGCLALRNSDIQDQIAVACAGAPVVARLHTLDLSMGTLGDEGAEALLNGQPLTHLRRLDLHHHFISAPLVERLRTTFEAAGVSIDLSEAELGSEDDEDDEHRYTSVAE